MIVLDSTEFHIRKLIFIWITQERLALHLVQIWQLSHKSIQNYVTSEKNESYLECCFAKKLFTFRWIFLLRYWQESMRKTSTYLPLKYHMILELWSLETVLATRSVLRLFWQWLSFIISRFVQATIAQNTAVLRRCHPRTSGTAICAFRKV